jgi:disulfide bond formation protein DsbB
LAAAHAFERFGGFAPCPLCLDQREWHWGVVAASSVGIAWIQLQPNRAWVAAALIGCVYVGATAMATYHVAVEQHWITAQCEVTPAGDLAFDVNADFAAPSCDTPAWTLFTISMAGYNALISFALTLASFAVAFAPARTRANG